jgi:hypothetical protein
MAIANATQAGSRSRQQPALLRETSWRRIGLSDEAYGATLGLTPQTLLGPAMKKPITALVLLSFMGAGLADNISRSDKLLCSASEVIVCFEGGDCLEVLPVDLGVPQFVVIDLKKKLISTTKASGENRSTPIQALNRDETAIYLQGVEHMRAFSFVIDQATGLLTVAVSRDGLTASVFGACTDTDVD